MCLKSANKSTLKAKQSNILKQVFPALSGVGLWMMFHCSAKTETAVHLKLFIPLESVKETHSTREITYNRDIFSRYKDPT